MRPLAVPSNYTTPIPKNSNFALNDWILKNYGSFHGKVAQIVGYHKGYYGPGNYLIQFLDGKFFATKQKYFRGPYKTKEIALQYQADPPPQDKPEDLRLKPNSIREEYQTSPKTEQAIKEKYTKAPFNFTWLETPIILPSKRTENNTTTVLAVREDKNVKLPSPYRDLTAVGVNQFCIIRYNNSLTKKLSMSEGSPYQIYYPNPQTQYTSSDRLLPLNFSQPGSEQVEHLYRIQILSYKRAEEEAYSLDGKFEGYNTFVGSKKLTHAEFVEAIGGITRIGSKKVLTIPINWNRYSFLDQSIIRDYSYKGPYQFNDDTAVNLNNCPREAKALNIWCDTLQNLSSNNHPNIRQILINRARNIKSLQGLDTFTGIENIVLSDDVSLESLEGCPSGVELFIRGTEITSKTLKGLPKTLKTMDIRAELDRFDCSDTIIDGQLGVRTRPKSLEGLPKANKYRIEGYTQEEIDEELNFRKLRDKLPELEGIF